MCNEVPVELLKIAKIEPARAAERCVRNRDGTPRLQHVAYAVPPAMLEAVRADFEASRLPEYLSARFGDDVDMSYHDAGATLGHDAELHADSEGLRGFFAMVREAAASWDGSDLLRPPPGD